MRLSTYRYQTYSPHFGGGPPLTLVVKRLLIANIACFVAQRLSGGRFDIIFGLVPALALSRLYVWQFATYMFLHGGVIHLLFNMFILWMFGRDVEMSMGPRRFTIYYFFCGIGAGLCSFIFYPPYTVIVGASGAIFGLMVAFGMIFPERVVTLLLFFVLPVSMKAKHLVMIMAGIEFLFVVSNVRGDFVAHFAHLGGALFGFMYMKNIGNIQLWLDTRRIRRPRVKIVDEEAEDLRGKVDELLDKISKHGLSGLTEEEKQFLRRAKEKL
jgi:membrane associated rhomboid family serine protease